MARGTGAGTAACAFHLEVVGLRDVEQIVAVGYGEGVGLRFLVYECYGAPGKVLVGIGLTVWGELLFAGRWWVKVAVAGYRSK